MSERHQVIPAEAIEAAAVLIADREGYGWVNDEHRDAARTILEAAAPHMLAAAWEEGVEALAEHPDPTNPYRPTI